MYYSVIIYLSESGKLQTSLFMFVSKMPLFYGIVSKTLLPFIQLSLAYMRYGTSILLQTIQVFLYIEEDYLHLPKFLLKLYPHQMRPRTADKKVDHPDMIVSGGVSRHDQQC